MKREFATTRTELRTLADAMRGADVLVGLSKGGMVSQEMVRSMAARPIIFALANPTPEISYEEAKAANPEVLMSTGRTDYPNQINNVLAFPYIFRGRSTRTLRLSTALWSWPLRALSLRWLSSPCPTM